MSHEVQPLGSSDWRAELLFAIFVAAAARYARLQTRRDIGHMADTTVASIYAPAGCPTAQRAMHAIYTLSCAPRCFRFLYGVPVLEHAALSSALRAGPGLVHRKAMQAII